MTDEYGFDAEVSLDIAKATKAARELAQSIAKIQDATGGTDKSLDRLERTAAESGRAMEQFAKSGNAAASSAKAQQGSIQRLIKSYNDLNQAQGAQKNKGAVNQQNPLLQQRIKQEQDAAKKQAQYEREFARLSTQETRKAAAEKTKYEQQFSKLVADENKKRAAIEQRTAEQVSAVWKRAHDENRRRTEQATVGAATSSANTAGAGALRGPDPFAGLRDTVAYTDMLDRSVQGLANQRYALYDVATTFGLISVATLGAATSAAILGGNFEKAFDQVERTTLGSAQELETLHDQLIGISTAIPVAFADIAEIATLGAQLNIATENLDTFTTTVAQFAATTDVSVNAAAMGFGRLAQLTQTPQTEIDRLGSSIYQVGINSVATESEILAVSQQIATAGNLAGFSNTEIVALASSLASLGVAPEQSRGAIMRVFGDITAAVGEGGDALRQFSQVSGMSSEAFAAAWKNAPQEAFNAYIAGLENVIKTNGDLDTSLKNQGFRNIRDRNVLTRLANNTEVYAAALDDTSEAYANNTALSEGAAIANDNLIDKLTVLVNTVKAVAAEAGQNEGLKNLADILNTAAKAALEFVDTPFGGFIASTVLVLGALVGGISAMAAGMALGKASLLAIITALYNSRQAAAGTTLGLKALTTELLRSTTAGNAAAGAMTRFKVATAAAGGGLGGMATAARSTATGMSGAAVATRGLGAALRTVGSLVAPLLILQGISAVIGKVQDDMKSGADRATEYFEALEGGGAGLDTAIAADTKAFEETGEALRVVTTEVKTSRDVLTGWASNLQSAAGAQVTVNDATGTTTTSVQNQTLALGDNARAWMANTLANDENFQKIFAQQDKLNAIGFNVQDFVDATLKGDNGGVAYLESLITKTAELQSSTGQLTGEQGLAFSTLASEYSGLITVAQAYQNTVDGQVNKTEIFRQIMGDAGLAAQGLEGDLEDAAGGAVSLADGLSPMVEALFGSVNATAAAQQAIYDLGASLGEGGTSFSEFSETGRANLAALNDTISAMATQAGEDTGVFISNVGGLLQQLSGMGVNVEGELGFVGEMLADITNQQFGLNLDTASARGSIKVFIDDAIKALQTVAALEKRSFQQSQNAVAGSLYIGGKRPGAGTVLAPVTGGTGTSSTGQAIEAQIKGLQELSNGISTAGKAGVSAGNNLSNGFNKGAEAAKKAGGAAKKAGKDAAGGAKQIRTLLDYAGDIESVFNRSFEIRFGVDQAADSAAGALDKMRSILTDADKAIVSANEDIESTAKSLRDARVAVQEFNAQLQTLRADNHILEYQLRVAIEYGDDLRATDIQAKLAENAVEITKAEDDRADAVSTTAKEQRNLTNAEQALVIAQNDAIRSLDGGSASSREQRAAVLALVQSYQGQIQALAASGASTSELQRKTDELEAEFRAQLQAMGYSRTETDRYAQSFRDLSYVLANVPRNITVSANMNPAQQAINEFLARNANQSINIKANVSSPGSIGGGAYNATGINVGGGGISTPKIAANTVDTNSVYNRGGLSSAFGTNRPVWTGGYIGPGFSGGGLIPGKTPTNHKVDNVQGMGPNGPIRVQSGEFIQNSRAVRHYGLPFMNALNNMQIPRFNGGGSVGGNRAGGGGGMGNGIQLVELMPTQLQQLAQMVKASVYLDGKQIAGAVNTNNTQGAIRGTK